MYELFINHRIRSESNFKIVFDTAVFVLYDSYDVMKTNDLLLSKSVVYGLWECMASVKNKSYKYFSMFLD